jgi:small subunit ribosomal protein S6
MYILDPALEGNERKELIDRFTKLLVDNGATIDKADEWGKRRLAYPINFKNEGYYVLINFTAGPDVPREIERNLRISDQVMRSMVVKLEDKHTSVKPRPVVVRQTPVFVQPAPAAPIVEEIPAAAAPVEEKAPPSEESPAPVEAKQEAPAVEPALTEPSEV